MLNIINNLAPFFEDCYRRISVREYGKLIKVSPPTASKLLKDYNKQGLLNKSEELRHLFFSANRESRDFIDLSRVYWRKKLKDFISELQRKLVNPTAVLFGSLAKAEAKKDSDIDIFIFSQSSISININKFEKELGRKISIFQSRSIDTIKNTNLLNNVLNGYLLFGRLKLK